MKHNLNQVGKKYIFTIRDLIPDDAGLYQLHLHLADAFIQSNLQLGNTLSD